MRSGAAIRVLDSPPRSAAEHMALDRVITEARSRDLVPNTLRFLQFRPCALVGLHQDVRQEVQLAYCRQQGIEINRRITGGGSLYWGPRELGWELYAAKNTPGIPRKVEDMYRLLCEAMAAGLQRLGVAAAYRPVNDIETGGRKIAGTGGTELGEAFVFQCSLLVDFDVDEMLRVLRFPPEKLSDKAVSSMRDRVTSLRRELGSAPDLGVVKTAILQGLSERLGYALEPGELTGAEERRLAELLPEFQSERWIFGEAAGTVRTVDSHADYKAPGGLIRIGMRLDENKRVIKYVLISGDFFAYPARAVQDLETVLKNTPASPDRIRERIDDFFAGNQVHIPGVTAADFCAAVALAARRSHGDCSL